MKLKSYLTQITWGIILLMAVSCSDMNELHDVYLQKGETIYTGRVDSAKVFAGNERVLLRYWISDAKAKNIVVYWLSRTDSVILNIPDKQLKDSVDLLINRLPEGSLYFEIFSLNKDMRNKSVPFGVGGSVYGGKYQSTLLNRTIKTLKNDTITGTVTITWVGSINKSVGCEMEYTDSLGSTVFLRIPPKENPTLLQNVAGNLRYRTLFLPEETAIDTFYTDFKSIPLN